MLTNYAAYLIRCWRDRTGLKRVEIVHVQTGERALAGSEAEALAWIDSHGAGAFSRIPEVTGTVPKEID